MIDIQERSDMQLVMRILSAIADNRRDHDAEDEARRRSYLEERCPLCGRPAFHDAVGQQT